MTAAGPEHWRERPVLVTGGGGFLGSHVVDALKGAGAAVVTLLRDGVRRVPALDGVTTVAGDVTDQALVERVLGDYEIKTVFHLAAQSQVQVANRNPVETFESNIRGTWTVLEAVRRSPTVTSVLVASSDKAYGTQPVLPYSEEMPLLAVHPYDVSKACTDMIAACYHRVFGVPVSVTRCGNLFGPGDTNWQRLIPSTMRSLLRGERPIIRSDGTAVRDYLFVVDAAAGYLRLAEGMEQDPGLVGEAFNLTTEHPLSVLELVNLIAKGLGAADLEPVIQGRASHEISEQHLSAEKARRLLGWSPAHTVEEGLRLTADWYRQEAATLR